MPQPLALILEQNIAAACRAFEACGPTAEPLGRAAEMVAVALNGGRRLLVCGNGGSAADAQHFATEFVCRFTHDRRPYPAICLNVSGGDLTAIGNDYAFEEVFARQVRAFGQQGDVLVAFTSSGKSRNVQLALEAARERGVQSIAFLGRDGGFCRGLATVDILAPGENTARIQEAHKLLLHTLCETVEQHLNRS